MIGALSRGLLLLAALMVSMLTAANAGALSLVSDPLGLHREAVDESRYPWSSVGKLYNETGSACSGVVIAPDKILTAAHCLFNYRTARFIAADALHFLVGYRTGRYSVHVRVARYEIGAGFDPLRYDATSQADWAVLTATESLPVAIEPLRLRRALAPSGTRATLVGYPQDRAFAMTADRDCELRGDTGGGRLFLHTCRGVKGYSGAPILISSGGRDVEVAGIQIATMRGEGVERMLAVPAQSIGPHANDDSEIQASAGLAAVPTGAACAAAEGEAAWRLDEIQTRLGFEPAEPDELNADAADVDIVAFIPDKTDRFPASALAWFAMEPFAIALP